MYRARRRNRHKNRKIQNSRFLRRWRDYGAEIEALAAATVTIDFDSVMYTGQVVIANPEGVARVTYI